MFMTQKAFNYAPSATYVANIKINLCKPWIIRKDHCALKRRVLAN